MNALLVIVGLLAIGMIIYSRRERPPVDDIGTVPLTPAAREYRWRSRMDSTLGAESEKALRMGAVGAIAKRRLLADARNREGKALARIKHATKPDKIPVPITVRRPLRMARY